MDFEKLKARDNKYLLNNYNKYDIAFAYGKGSYIYGIDGKKYLDFTSGIGVNCLGINDVKWLKAVKKQLKEIQHTCNLYYNEPQVKLASMLVRKTNCKKVFLCNSGAEANEAAIKCARKYSYDKYGKDRYEIITLKNSFHGRTIATLSATGQESMHNYFNPFVDGFRYADVNDLNVLKTCVSKKTCAIMIETIQGEGGVNNLTEEYINGIYKLCKEKDILLIVDEVQTGNGRTGKLYSYMHYDIKPDIVTTAKGLGGGLPIGAVLFFKKTSNTLTGGTHGSTFGGNPVCAAAAVSVLSRLDENFLKDIAAKGNYLKNKILTMHKVKSVTGKGLMIGVEAESDTKELVNKLADAGLLVLTAKNKIRLLPPLNITYEQIDEAITVFKKILD